MTRIQKLGPVFFLLLASMSTSSDVGAQCFGPATAGNSACGGKGLDLSGRWNGSWSSYRTGHQGRLSARFRQLDSTTVRASFRGTFAKVVPFWYPARLSIVDQQPGRMVLEGRQRLGPLMGTFRYQAVITPGSFDATYSSRRDRGQWKLSR